MHDLAVLRFHDRESDFLRSRPAGGDRADAAGAGNVGRRRRQDHHSAASEDSQRRRFPRRPAEHRLHGSLHAKNWRKGGRTEKSSRGRLTLSPLSAIIDADVAARCGLTVPAVAAACLAGGARFIQIRAKTAPSAVLLRMVEDGVERAHNVGATVIVNDRADIARLAGADGVHLGQDDLEPAMARRVVGGEAIVGYSTHSIEQSRAACSLPIDSMAAEPWLGTA